MKILVTGGAGYIGSHTCKRLAQGGHEPVVFDNLSTGHRDFVRYGPLAEGDLADPASLDRAFAEHRPEAIIHFAASAYVGESVTDPLKYYHNNVGGTANLLSAAVAHGVRDIIFSSSCATYGVPDTVPIDETARQQPINPYGDTKLFCETMLRGVAAAHGLRCIALRYFNAAGADPDGELGESHDPETHAIPLILSAARGDIAHFSVFGTDYATPDGSCVRDFLHVSDLADAHFRALDALAKVDGFTAINLGTGTGHSVLETIAAVERVTGRAVPVVRGPRRPGDPAALVADARLAADLLGWTPRHSSLDTIVSTAWNWMHAARPLRNGDAAA